jgi:hypothetical protein
MKTFKDIKSGIHFYFSGTWWEKRSSRTAHVFGRPTRWFYFSKDEYVIVNDKAHKEYTQLVQQ